MSLCKSSQMEAEQIFEYFEKNVISNRNSEHLKFLAQAAVEAGNVDCVVLQHIDIMHKKVSRTRQWRYLLLHIYKCLQSGWRAPDYLLNILMHPSVPEEAFDHLRKYLHEVISSSASSNTLANELLLCEERHISLLFKSLAKYSHKWKDIGRLLLPCHILSKIEYKFKTDCNACLYDALSEWLRTSSPTLKKLKDALASEAVGLGRLAMDLEMAVLEFLNVESDNNVSIDDGEWTHLKLSGCGGKIDLQDSGVAVLLEVKVKNKYSKTNQFQWYKDGVCIHGENDCILCIVAEDITAEATYTCKMDACSKQSNAIAISVKTPVDKCKKILAEQYDAEPEVLPDTWPDVEQNTYINLAILKGNMANTECNYTRQSIQGDLDDVLLDKNSTDYKSAFMSIEQSCRILVVGRPGSGKTTLVHKISQDWARGEIELKSVRLLFLVHLRGFRSDPLVGLKEIVERYFKDQVEVSNICSYAEKHRGLGCCFVLDGLDEYQPRDNETFLSKLIKRHELPKAIVIVSSRPAAIAELRQIATKEIEVLGFFKDEIAKYIQSYRFSSKSSSSDLVNYLNQHPNVHQMCYLPIQSAMICFLFNFHGDLPTTETQIYDDFTKHAILRTLYRNKSSNDRVYLKSIASLKTPEKDSFHNICQLAFEKTHSSLQILEQTEVDHFCKNLKFEDNLGLITVDLRATKCGFQNIYTFCHLTFQEFLAAYYILFQERPKQADIIRSCGPKDHMQMVFKFFCGLAKFDDDFSLFTELFASTNFKLLFRVQCAFETQQSQICDFVACPFFQFKDLFMTSSDFTALGYVISRATQNIVNGLSFDCSPTDDGIAALHKALEGHNPCFETLEFRGCAKGHLQALANLITALPKLEVFGIADTEQVSKDVESISSILRHDKLKVLKFCCASGDHKHQPLPVEQLEKLVDIFFSKCSALKNICFSATNREFLYSKISKRIPFFLFSIVSESKASYTNCAFSTPELKALLVDFYCGSECVELSLINCNVDDEKATLLAEALKTKNILEVLKLTANKIGDSGAMALAKCLPQTQIQLLLAVCNSENISLSLFGNNVTFPTASKDEVDSMKVLEISGHLRDTGIAHVKSYFNKQMTLESLQLNSCGNTFDGLESIISMVRKCPFLLSIKLIDCSVDDHGAELLASYIRDNVGLHAVDLSRNKINSFGAKALVQALKFCSQLEVLNLNENKIKTAGAVSLSECLNSCKNIKDLEISDNCICDAGVEALGEVIRVNTRLQVLKLGGNFITDIGAHSLASSLALNACLLEIDLSRNSIGSSGISALAEPLQNCSALHTLNLGQNDLGGGVKILGKCLKKLGKLVNINLSRNHIGVDGGTEAVADSSLKDFECIENLDLSDNKVSDVGIIALTDCLSKCSNLTQLNMSYNSISTSGSSVFAYLVRHASKLVTLDVSHNGIDFSALRACKSLSNLDMSYNRIGDQGLKMLVVYLKTCTSLQSLSLQSCGIRSFRYLYGCFIFCEIFHSLNLSDNGIWSPHEPRLEFLENCLNLRSLVLCNNNITTLATIYFIQYLKYGSQLRILDLNGNSIDSGISALVRSLVKCPNIHTLRLGNANISNCASEFIVSCLKGCGNLHTLDISGLLRSCPSLLVHLMKDNDNLRALYSSQNQLSDDCIVKLSKFCGNLKILDLSRNEIADNGVKALGECFKVRRNLQELYLGHNNIGTEGVIGLAESLVCCTDLHQLSLRKNKIGNKGIEVLVNSFKNCQLRTFDLSHSCLSLSGAEVLANFLKNCLSLTSLGLQNMKESIDGAIALVLCLKRLHNLQHLSISFINFTDGIAMAMAYALKGSCNLRVVDLSGITLWHARYARKEVTGCGHDSMIHLTTTNCIEKGVEALAMALQSCGNLRTVKCSQIERHYFDKVVESYNIPLQIVVRKDIFEEFDNLFCQ